MGNNILKADRCGIHFGGLQALSRFSFELNVGELAGIIGPNGAGKTTFFNLLTGVCHPTEGDLFFEGRCLNDLKPFQISRLGIARTFQNIRLFPELTVLDNVLIACHVHIRGSLLDAVRNTKAARREEEKHREAARTLLETFGLLGLEREEAQNLSYGDQRRLEIVRALATGPRLLLLDEPAAGMNTAEKNHLIELIRLVHQRYKIAILLIEHDMGVVMNLCPRLLVLDYGEVIAEGTPDEIRCDSKVIEAYLGTMEKITAKTEFDE